MPSALMIANRQRVNGYTQARYPTYQTFYNEVSNYRRVQMPSRPPIQPLTDDDGRNLRELRAAVAVDDGLDEISYPIATIDTCDCVTFPDAAFTLAECTNDAYWGTFQLKLTDGSCYDVSFDETLVYQNCPSGAYPEEVTEYVLCEVDFTAGTDSSESLATSDEAPDTIESTTETTTTSNLRQEGTGGTKKTHIHFSVHRLLSVVLEGLLALQYPA
ncbi:hypothetical protein V7S43_002176 [Phytophthora oleae]|uniref:Uncharacterized protein n=1 Tax=Phytophthora oleae TaxID=2107226 RepID=A0ABD3G6W2_9STRA